MVEMLDIIIIIIEIVISQYVLILQNISHIVVKYFIIINQ